MLKFTNKTNHPKEILVFNIIITKNRISVNIIFLLGKKVQKLRKNVHFQNPKKNV